MKKNEKYIIIFIAFISLSLILICGNVNISNLAADAGFDSSYNSHSGYNGGFNSGGNYGFGNGRIPSNLDEIIFFPLGFVFAIIILAIDVKIIKYRANKEKQKLLPENTRALSQAQNEIPGFNAKEFKKQVSKDFITMQESIMNYDYKTLKTLLTDELYNTYKTRLESLELKHQKNKLYDFKLIDCSIISYHQDEEKYIISVGLKIKYYDYIVNKNGMLINGDNSRRVIMTYDLTYVKSKLQKFSKCPNCNTELDKNTNHCPKCNSVIVSSSHDWLLSNKTATNKDKEIK